eukprot:c12672_g1_i1.p1 GENE.c12672_g1_i1~~c12672_g1_i1.p1  ORF type:complete len:293 (-),score=50.39 c12672_g1_i1:201-1079(-)
MSEKQADPTLPLPPFSSLASTTSSDNLIKHMERNQSEGDELFSFANFYHAAQRYHRALNCAQEATRVINKSREKNAKALLLQVESNHTALELRIAQCYEQLNQWDMVLAQTSCILTRNPRHPVATDLHKMAQDHTGTAVKAKAATSKSVSSPPKSPLVTSRPRLPPAISTPSSTPPIKTQPLASTMTTKIASASRRPSLLRDAFNRHTKPEGPSTKMSPAQHAVSSSHAPPPTVVTALADHGPKPPPVTTSTKQTLPDETNPAVVTSISIKPKTPQKALHPRIEHNNGFLDL